MVGVPLPSGVGEAELDHPSPGARLALERASRAWFEHAEGKGGDVIGFLGADGRPLRPDAERARAAQRIREMGAVENELTFDLDCPDDPWSDAERASVTEWLATCQAQLRSIYGPPAFANVVRVCKAATAAWGAAGTYNYSLNLITVDPGSVSAPVVCHELAHAFHDDDVVAFGCWEEGMAAAVEVEAMQRAGIPDPGDHGYGDDVHYEALNQPAVAASHGWFWAGWSQTLLRYQLAGYAWAKPLIEDDGFFPRFNSAYYTAVAADAAVTADEEALLALASAASPSVEDQPFREWYLRQHVLQLEPPSGQFLYLRVGPGTIVSAYARAESGVESDLAGVNVRWGLEDDLGNLLCGGAVVTNLYGVGEVGCDTVGYQGRVRFTATAQLDGAETSAEAYEKATFAEAVFGIVVGADSGTITFTPVEEPGLAVTVEVVHGAFEAPSLLQVRGKIRYLFRGGDGTTASGTFTKDAQPYFVLVHASVPVDSTPPILTPQVTGTVGPGGWYVSDVTVIWAVEDSESAVSAAEGCGPVTFSADTAGSTVTCTAASAGGSSSASVTIRRDATAPTLTCARRLPIFTARAAHARVYAIARDATSGPERQIAWSAADARSSGLHWVRIQASDRAGNSGAVWCPYLVKGRHHPRSSWRG